MADHLAPRRHPRQWTGIALTLAAIVATVTLVLAERASGPSLETGPAPHSKTAATVLGEVITRSSLPEAEAAEPVAVGEASAPSSTSTSATSTTKPGTRRNTTTVPDPVLIPPVTVENTTTTSTSTTSTTTSTTAPPPEP